MAERLAIASTRRSTPRFAGRAGADIRSTLVSYLTDARAIEAQALCCSNPGRASRACPRSRTSCASTSTRRAVTSGSWRTGSRAHDAKPSRFQNTAFGIGGANLGAFFAAQPDTPVKLAGFAYAFEHLEIAAYELLRRVADRAGDEETVAVAERILAEEHRAAEQVAATWDAAVDAVLGNLVGEGAR